jgi:predicted nucleic acid-binding protein
MAVLFFDTSALVRRYDQREPGSESIRDLCDVNSGHTLIVSRIIQVEVASALNRKLREGVLSKEALQRMWDLFQAHRLDQYQVLSLDETTLLAAERLLFAHQLRGVDAVHLASALGVAALLGDVVHDFRFCTADRAQAAAARRENLTVDLIA